MKQRGRKNSGQAPRYWREKKRQIAGNVLEHADHFQQIIIGQSILYIFHDCRGCPHSSESREASGHASFERTIYGIARLREPQSVTQIKLAF
jgi:hypothetical protein